jgi:uncharacterized protein with PIN domain
VKIRLYIDEDAMDTDLVQALRLRGVDLRTVQEERRKGYSDEQQLEFAAAQGRVLYSFNVKHYMPLHARLLERGASHAGIILTEQHIYSIGEQMRRILRIIAAKPAEEIVNQLVFLSAWGEGLGDAEEEMTK